MDSVLFPIIEAEIEKFNKAFMEIETENLREKLVSAINESNVDYYSENNFIDKFKKISVTFIEKSKQESKKFLELITAQAKTYSGEVENSQNQIEKTNLREKVTKKEDLQSDINSTIAIISNTVFYDWEFYFSKYYVSANENYYGNFDNYLTNCLKLLNHFPETDWEKEIQNKTAYLPINFKRKKTLILDLDETLIHADLEFTYFNHDLILDLNLEDQSSLQIPIFIRPFLIEFLEFAATKFELICFTASCKNYADRILDYIEKDKNYFSKRLYRESCLYLHPGIYIKDLRIIANRNLKDVVIIDNSIFSFANQLSNGILISSFYNDKNDNILNYLRTYLDEYINNSDDVRVINTETFQLEKYKEIVKNEEDEPFLQ